MLLNRIVNKLSRGETICPRRSRRTYVRARPRPGGTDRRTDGRISASLNAPPYGGGIIIVNRLFSDINVSQGSVATYARYGVIFNNLFTAKLPENQTVTEFGESVKI